MTTRRKTLLVVLALLLAGTAAVVAQDLDLGSLMIDFESHMRWEAVAEEWVDERDGWVAYVADLEAVRAY